MVHGLRSSALGGGVSFNLHGQERRAAFPTPARVMIPTTRVRIPAVRMQAVSLPVLDRAPE